MSDFKLASVAAIFRYQLQTYYLQFYLHINQSSCVCIALNHSQRKCLAQLEDQRNPAVWASGQEELRCIKKPISRGRCSAQSSLGEKGNMKKETRR